MNSEELIEDYKAKIQAVLNILPEMERDLHLNVSEAAAALSFLLYDLK